MEDCFASLGLPRQIWLDPALVKERFLAVSAEVHPDKAPPERKAEAEATFAQANRSHRTLQSPRLRLLHWLELAGLPPAPHVQQVPAAVMGRFPEVAQHLKQADEFLARKRAATSPMVQVQLFQAGLELTTQLQELQAHLASDIRALESELQTLPPPHPAHYPRLQEIAASLGFLERWQAQLADRLSHVAF